jgi:hypothetical protein
VNRQRLVLVIGNPGEPGETLVNLAIEDSNREDMQEIMRDTVNLVYDGEYEMEENE